MKHLSTQRITSSAVLRYACQEDAVRRYEYFRNVSALRRLFNVSTARNFMDQETGRGMIRLGSRTEPTRTGANYCTSDQDNMSLHVWGHTAYCSRCQLAHQKQNKFCARTE